MVQHSQPNRAVSTHDHSCKRLERIQAIIGVFFEVKPPFEISSDVPIDLVVDVPGHSPVAATRRNQVAPKGLKEVAVGDAIPGAHATGLLDAAR